MTPAWDPRPPGRATRDRGARQWIGRTSWGGRSIQHGWQRRRRQRNGRGRPEAGTRSSGCGKPVMRPDRAVQQTMQVGGTTRYYLLDVPASVTNETPLTLIFALHGANMNNVSVVGLYNFGTRSNGQAITVYPQGDGDAPGTTSKWGSGITSRWTSNDTNFGYIEALITELESRYCIDPSRVFVTGFSMGGGSPTILAASGPTSCAPSHRWKGTGPEAYPVRSSRRAAIPPARSP